MENDKELNINNKITLSIEYDAIEPKKINYSLDKMQEIYNSNYINKFIDLFDSLPDKNLKL